MPERDKDREIPWSELKKEVRWDEGMTPEEREQALDEGIAALERYEREEEAMNQLADMLTDAIRQDPHRLLDFIQANPPSAEPMKQTDDSDQAKEHPAA